MTNEDEDSTDQHSIRSEEGGEAKSTRRGRLKDALNRTKTKLNKVREERGVKKQTRDQDKPDYQLNDDVNDFLAAGRASFASSLRPSIVEDSSIASPRPSTSDSNVQASPRRGPPKTIPRIDVSNSMRFPNAKDVNPDALVESGGLGFGTARSTSLLKPEYQTRSQSASSLVSGKRKDRSRKLSVGFVATPPDIIGEGGDEAQAPPVEISRAKQARARSASPQGQKPYSNAVVQPGARRQMPGRGISDNTADVFTPKPFARAQTGMLPGERSPGYPQNMHDNPPMPRPFVRTQTGLSGRDPVSTIPTTISTKQERAFLPEPLARIETGKLDLTKEFEMSLGLIPQVPHASKASATENIIAPKPQRVPPSYDLIEKGGSNVQRKQVNGPLHEARVVVPKPPSATRSHQRQLSDHMRSQPAATSQFSSYQQSPQQSLDNVQTPSSTSPSARPSLPPRPNPPDYFPPPPQRQPSHIVRNIQNLEPIHAKHSAPPTTQQNDSIVGEMKIPLSIVTEQDNDEYQSFALRSRFRSSSNSPRPENRNIPPPHLSTIRPVPSTHYDMSPSEYTGSNALSPRSPTTPGVNKPRFYENLSQGNRSGNFI
ncbi:hypothetical protein LTR05_001475 [Lithohypha guttulata]|uniref:Uncharacterized protein n=1 Tax=Lithohypha guttulata TaxID=1690604 RepID=A0AAN7YK83_9EURO|nr:hypothetical protein LTR05_001475 [Lithohypha guttulata]